MDDRAAEYQVTDPLAPAKLFLRGPAGTGKTTYGTQRLLALLEDGVTPSSILVMVPQHTLAEPYQEALRSFGHAGPEVTVATISGLARKMIRLFWPLVAEEAGFARPERPPVFLTLETAQFFMAEVVRPRRAEGAFAGLTVAESRLYSQILDNLNKAAVTGLPLAKVGERLKEAWTGDLEQHLVYDDAQGCAEAFRARCLEEGLLDFSLQLEVFYQHLWPLEACRDHLRRTYRHLIVDNVEEDSPASHDLLRAWLPYVETALVIYDEEAGYRRFLGADPTTAADLADTCGREKPLRSPVEASPALLKFGERLARAAGYRRKDRAASASNGSSTNGNAGGADSGLAGTVQILHDRYYPRMLARVANEVAELVEGGEARPSEVVIVAPFVPDSLRYVLGGHLDARGVSFRSHRPSRPLGEESATHALLTLVQLAHPSWEANLDVFDVAHALGEVAGGLDPVRARLLAARALTTREGGPALKPFSELPPEVRDRVTYEVGERYEVLRGWLEECAQAPPEALDHCLSRLFGEVISQPGFGFHDDFKAAEVATNLIESIRKFRKVLTESGLAAEEIGPVYLDMVREGVAAARYARSWTEPEEEAVLLAPAYTFLMRNRPACYQFWLDVGSRAWYSRINQPITHPYVLSRAWPSQRKWTDRHEQAVAREVLGRLVLGLVRRCRERVYLGVADLGEHGEEQRGMLLEALQRVRRQYNGAEMPRVEARS